MTTTKETNPKDAFGSQKVGLSCVPMTVVLELATAMREGAQKYGRHNWRESGVRSSVYFDAAIRHLFAWWEGEEIDPDSGISHLTKAMASLAVLRDGQMQSETQPELFNDDRPVNHVKRLVLKMNTKIADPNVRFREIEVEKPIEDGCGNAVMPFPGMEDLENGPQNPEESKGSSTEEKDSPSTPEALIVPKEQRSVQWVELKPAHVPEEDWKKEDIGDLLRQAGSETVSYQQLPQFRHIVNNLIPSIKEQDELTGLLEWVNELHTSRNDCKVIKSSTAYVYTKICDLIGSQNVDLRKAILKDIEDCISVRLLTMGAPQDVDEDRAEQYKKLRLYLAVVMTSPVHDLFNIVESAILSDGAIALSGIAQLTPVQREFCNDLYRYFQPMGKTGWCVALREYETIVHQVGNFVRVDVPL